MTVFACGYFGLLLSLLAATVYLFLRVLSNAADPDWNVLKWIGLCAGISALAMVGGAYLGI